MLTVNYVVQTTGVRVPKLSVEAVFRLLGKLAEKRSGSRVAELVRESAQNTQRVVPERLNLDRLPCPGRDHPIADLGVHPRELDTGLTACQKAVAVQADPIAGAAGMPVDDFLQLRIESRAYKVIITRVLQVGADGFEKPERCVDGVVFGWFPRLREAVGKHALIGTLS